MKKLFAVFALMLSMSFAHANTDTRLSGYDNLSDAQKAELAVKVSEMASQQKAPAVPTIGTVEKWAGFGQQIGSALAGTARELGIVANEFIKTPAGQVTMYLVIWKVMGSEVVHVGAGLLILSIFVPLWIYLFRRMCIIKGFNIKTITDDAGKTKNVKVPEFFQPSEVSEERGWMLVILGIILAVSVLTIFTM